MLHIEMDTTPATRLPVCQWSLRRHPWRLLFFPFSVMLRMNSALYASGRSSAIHGDFYFSPFLLCYVWTVVVLIKVGNGAIIGQRWCYIGWRRWYNLWWRFYKWYCVAITTATNIAWSCYQRDRLFWFLLLQAGISCILIFLLLQPLCEVATLV
jgi:hypothetical protein